jgi:hypothetical protein
LEEYVMNESVGGNGIEIEKNSKNPRIHEGDKARRKRNEDGELLSFGKRWMDYYCWLGSKITGSR